LFLQHYRVYIIDRDLPQVSTLSCSISLRIIDRFFYYLGYLPFLTIAIAFFICFGKSKIAIPIRLVLILLLPILIPGLWFFLLLVLFVFLLPTGVNIDVTELHLMDDKFQNKLRYMYTLEYIEECERSYIWGLYHFMNHNSIFMWNPYSLKDLSSDAVEENVIQKIVHIFQNGISSLNSGDIDTMLKQTTDETATRLECFVEKQMNQQVIQIVNMLQNSNEKEATETTPDLLLVSRFEQLENQLKAAVENQLTDRLDHRIQNLAQKSMDRLDLLEQKLNKLELLEAKMDQLMNLLNEKSKN
jgi:hypothetical protein